MCLWCCWKDLYEQDLMEFIDFGFRMWEILILKVICAPENSNKFQKTRFWKEKSVEDVVTLGPPAQATLVSIMFSSNPFYLFLSHRQLQWLAMYYPFKCIYLPCSHQVP